MASMVGLSPQRIGQRVRERRLANGLTQRELGELAGVGVRLVSDLERGKSTLAWMPRTGSLPCSA